MRSVRSLNNPIILAHGLGGFRLGYFRGVREHLEKMAGVSVYVARVSPFASLELRGKQLADQTRRFSKQSGGRPINLIGHSMGGLDCRLVASSTINENIVASVTSVGSPHLGSSLAPNLSPALLPRWLRGIAQLSPVQMQSFSQRAPDSPLVRYFSISGDRPLEYLHPLYLMQLLLGRSEPGSNDGLVSRTSASAHGEYLGTVTLDHWSQVGWLCRAPGQHLELYDRVLTALADAEL